ncbi:hypothetical protein G6F24_017380 [Rhizopus arrhizus]|nr:hypothetical protein G6F24_017380 [Rhizopus arrhizus]
MHSPLRLTDPHATTAYITTWHGYMIYDTLLATDAANKIQPQMLEKWEVSPDGKTLYVAESSTDRLFRFDIGAGGTLSHKQEFLALDTVLADGPLSRRRFRRVRTGRQTAGADGPARSTSREPGLDAR